MSDFWSPVVKNLQPYLPGEQPKGNKLIKLNTNENPYGPSPHVLQALELEAKDTLRLYPDPNGEVLQRVIAPSRHYSDQRKLTALAVCV